MIGIMKFVFLGLPEANFQLKNKPIQVAGAANQNNIALAIGISYIEKELSGKKISDKTCRMLTIQGKLNNGDLQTQWKMPN